MDERTQRESCPPCLPPTTRPNRRPPRPSRQLHRLSRFRSLLLNLQPTPRLRQRARPRLAADQTLRTVAESRTLAPRPSVRSSREVWRSVGPLGGACPLRRATVSGDRARLARRQMARRRRSLLRQGKTSTRRTCVTCLASSIEVPSRTRTAMVGMIFTTPQTTMRRNQRARTYSPSRRSMARLNSRLPRVSWRQLGR